MHKTLSAWTAVCLFVALAPAYAGPRTHTKPKPQRPAPTAPAPQAHHALFDGTADECSRSAGFLATMRAELPQAIAACDSGRALATDASSNAAALTAAASSCAEHVANVMNAYYSADGVFPKGDDSAPAADRWKLQLIHMKLGLSLDPVNAFVSNINSTIETIHEICSDGSDADCVSRMWREALVVPTDGKDGYASFKDKASGLIDTTETFLKNEVCSTAGFVAPQPVHANATEAADANAPKAVPAADAQPASQAAVQPAGDAGVAPAH